MTAAKEEELARARNKNKWAAGESDIAATGAIASAELRHAAGKLRLT
jgi:hypothetical protein